MNEFYSKSDRDMGLLREELSELRGRIEELEKQIQELRNRKTDRNPPVYGPSPYDLSSRDKRR